MNLIALKIVGIYLIVGCLWIFFSDQLLNVFAHNASDTLTRLQTLKGWFYVAATAGLLYGLIHRETRASRIANVRLKQAIAQVQTTLEEREQTEARLQEREAILRLFAQYAPAGIAMFDHEMRYVMASLRWVEDYQLGSLESLIGRSHYDIFPEIPQRWRQIHQQGLAGIPQQCDEDLFVRADGTEQWIRWEIRPWFTVNGAVGGILLFSEDITQRKQADMALHNLNSELEQRVTERTAELQILNVRLTEAQAIAHIGSWEYDIITGNIFWSDEIFRIFGFTPGQDEPGYESHLERNFPLPEREQLRQAIARAVEYGEPYALDLQITRADGSTGWILAQGKPILNEQNQVVRLVGVALDITERKAIEAQQQRLSQLKDDFLSTVSHELRSPLASIKMAIELLEVTLERVLSPLEWGTKTNPQRLQKYLNLLHEQCDQELELVNNLLDLQRLEAERIPVELVPIDISEWIPNVTSAFDARIQERRQHLSVQLPPVPPPFHSDIDILTSVLRELLTNACKYTPPEETITVRIQSDERTLRLIVSNSGVQIPSEELSRIFDKFYRIPRSDRWKQGGTGLGLALIQKQIEYLKGSIWAESDESGVHIVVSLPMGVPEEDQCC